MIGAEGMLRESTAGVVSESRVDAEEEDDDEDEEKEDDLDCETRTGGWAGSNGEIAAAPELDGGAAESGDEPMVNTSWHRPAVSDKGQHTLTHARTHAQKRR
jgi:hypothetical protein